MSRLKGVLASLFFFVLAGFFWWWLGSDLLADIQNRSAQFEPARDIRVTEARCRSKLFVISFCDIKVSGAGVPGGSREISYLITGGVGDAEIGLQRATGNEPAERRHLSTRIGMDNLVNRIGSFGVLMAFLLAIAIGGLVAAVRGGEAAA